ncbi:hypothetical protein X011_18535 [Mycobacterium tuberculosis variant microti OV254]|nr:hypothetical protein X011_18535 [Mycobacterium tuberculosis variant microti OV254]
MAEVYLRAPMAVDTAIAGVAANGQPLTGSAHR